MAENRNEISAIRVRLALAILAGVGIISGSMAVGLAIVNPALPGRSLRYRSLSDDSCGYAISWQPLMPTPGKDLTMAPTEEITLKVALTVRDWRILMARLRGSPLTQEAMDEAAWSELRLNRAVVEQLEVIERRHVDE